MKEFVFLGHPDKQADLVADLLVEKALNADPSARCAIEVMLKGFDDRVHVFVAGETSHVFTETDIAEAVAEAHRLGTLGRDEVPDLRVVNALTRQSPYIKANMGSGVGDQCIVVGAAFSLSHPYYYHERFFSDVFTGLSCVDAWTGDGKMLVSADTSVLTLSLSGDLSDGQYGMLEEYLRLLADDRLRQMRERRIVVNPPGRSSWHGGPRYDCGVTGRKLACDAHGVFAPHGGGATSGKDMSKPDRGMKLVADELARAVRGRMLRDGLEPSWVSIVLGYQMGDGRPLSATARSSLLDDFMVSAYLEYVMSEKYDEIVADVAARPFSVDVCHPWVSKSRQYLEKK